MKNSKLQRVLKRVLKVIVIILAIIGIFLTGTFTYHKISLKKEASLIQAYGQKLKVFDGEMNVLIEGAGAETVVLLTGYGTASPALDFKPLIEELKKDYRVVMIEPFGYGLSSQTKRERTAENMVAEIHEVTQQLKLDNYLLMGHSIAGIYGLNYVQKYRDEVKAFVGVDTSSPSQPWPGVDDRLISFAQKSGLFRLILSLGSDKKAMDETAKQMQMITFKNSGNDTVRRELATLSDTFSEAKGLEFPKDLPVLLFVSVNKSNMDNWLAYHQEQISGLAKGKVVELPGSHYLHHIQSPTIVAEMKDFLSR